MWVVIVLTVKYTLIEKEEVRIRTVIWTLQACAAVNKRKRLGHDSHQITGYFTTLSLKKKYYKIQ